MWRPHLIFLECRLDASWQQEVWPRHEKSVASAVDREPAARIFDFSHGSGVLFLRCRPEATAVAVASAASCGMQRASHLSMPTCPPSKVMELTCRLSCPGV